MLYFPVQPGWALFDGPPSDEEVAKRLRKAYKAQGLIESSAAERRMFDAEIGYSPVVPQFLKKDGRISDAISSAASRDQVEALMRHAHKHAERLGAAILGGSVAVAPYRLRDRTPCAHCDYRAVCGFDPGNGDRHRDLAKLGKDASWALISGQEAKPDQSAFGGARQ
ncbi:MAG: PD-(D/E)XK nuclease family protein [Candidatus Sericytochromatia bacterium]|uniref:PD-(D/E)XK nuclease family protein n=1 Tax=Candidatus Tanganyikabacteria bacterium TaxID=2961651 RepID=A0A937X8X6_9BACT|nr:PD-(D/E)XK nuclease family protein [Candidatus Tanganyikabacteria bacterium]